MHFSFFEIIWVEVDFSWRTPISVPCMHGTEFLKGQEAASKQVKSVSRASKLGPG